MEQYYGSLVKQKNVKKVTEWGLEELWREGEGALERREREKQVDRWTNRQG